MEHPPAPPSQGGERTQSVILSEAKRSEESDELLRTLSEKSEKR